jgi:hypothetical protein
MLFPTLSPTRKDSPKRQRGAQGKILSNVEAKATAFEQMILMMRTMKAIRAELVEF